MAGLCPEIYGQGLLLAEMTSNPGFNILLAAKTAGGSIYNLMKGLILHAGLVAERSTQVV